MMVTLQGQNFLVTACPCGEDVMTMVCMTGETQAATGGTTMIEGMARELTQAARLIDMLREEIRGKGG